jgi:hypothetical protein
MEQLIKETQTYYDRVRNTYHYTINSQNCVNTNQAGEFEFIIPPFPYPEHQGSQIGLFSLKECYICRQGDGSVPAQRASGSADFDPSGLYVRLEGLGFRSQNFTNFGTVGSHQQPSARQFFTVLNENGGADNGTSNIQQRVSGGKAVDMELVVSNPSGTAVKCRVLDMDDGNVLADNAQFFTCIHFTIELIPTEISNGR